MNAHPGLRCDNEPATERTVKYRAVVPMKRLADAKARLSKVLPDDIRRRLVLAMLGDVLDVLHYVTAISSIAVVSPDPDVAAFAKARDVETLDEPDGAGLNTAITLAQKQAMSRRDSHLLVLPGDVPLTTTNDVEDILALSAKGCGVVLVPSDDGGTNALLLSPPDALKPEFGASSFKRHWVEAQARGLVPVALESEGLGFDVDRPEHLAKLLASPDVGARYEFIAPFLTIRSISKSSDHAKSKPEPTLSEASFVYSPGG